MKKKPIPKENSSLDRMIEAISDKKNAWKKILLELEREMDTRKTEEKK
ncbi:hypothetical protein [Aequorivita ciconiae]|nr:hypothetical protein [Aequorivita sp. H23M31]